LPEFATQREPGRNDEVREAIISSINVKRNCYGPVEIPVELLVHTFSSMLVTEWILALRTAASASVSTT
jgi:hypothetical protein